MPRHCAVVSCTYADRKKENVVSLYRFPPEEKLRKTWLNLCGRDGSVNEPDLVAWSCAVGKLRVCSRHFEDSDFKRDLRFELLGVKLCRRVLKRDSVPHLNLMKIKEEPPDKKQLDDQASTSVISDPVFKEVSADEVEDIKWWKKLDSSEIIALNEQGSNSSVDEHFSDSPPVEQVEPVSGAILIQQQISSSGHDIPHAPSSLPASQTWVGEYGFTVSFDFHEKTSKGMAWTYSRIKDKLYVGKDVPCPINFSANRLMPNDVTIRAMTLYTSPEQVSEIVTRCVNHSMEEITKGIPQAEHLVRCESSMATYHKDESTGRHSVIVPFDNPPVGQQHSTYIYKFACFGSCAGGPNRRPLMLIFTLERGNEVIGRKKLDVKICACPGRDRKIEENQQLGLDCSSFRFLKKNEPSVELASLSDTLNFTKSVFYPPTKKVKIAHRKDGSYTLHVDSKDCYEFLLQMKKFYEICKTMEGLSPDITKALLNYQKKKDGD